MPDLIAQGRTTNARWRRILAPGQTIILGRNAVPWAIPWDDKISRQHAELRFQHGELEIRRLPSARNPIFFRGAQQDHFFIKTGEYFVIGETRFLLTDESVQVGEDSLTQRDFTEKTYSQQHLKRIKYRDADRRIEVLSRLPELIAGAGSDRELFAQLVQVVLTGVPEATAVAIVATTPQAGTEDAPDVAEAGQSAHVQVLHFDRRSSAVARFRPSQRLILRAMETEQSVLHVWTGSKENEKLAFTISEGVDWAFCTPVPGEACRGWAIYVAGGSPPLSETLGEGVRPDDLTDDLKFTELAASTLGNLREMRLLERRDASLSQFLSPIVLEAVGAADPETVLAPREADVAVMFCDLRGFSRQSERGSGDLFALLQRVSKALGVMTHHILAQGGVIGDFHGDAAMGFWGWPLPQADAIERACRAALGIRAEFEAARTSGDPLSGFRVGIGIAAGRAVAGKIGTIDQVKVTVFGPVVNLASRLEGMTKIVRAGILLDESAAGAIRAGNLPAQMRVRRVARVRPYGLDTPLEIGELLPAESPSVHLTSAAIALYEQALDAVIDGNWQLANDLLSQVPDEDSVKEFLLESLKLYQHRSGEEWNGVIPLTSK